jgi:hypothetical protein
MSVTTQQYIRKPLYVDAVRITEANFDAIVTWCQGEMQQDEVPGKGTGKKYIKVRVHNPKNPRQTKAFVGDWLLYTERGYKVYTNKAFHASFDIVAVQKQSGQTLAVANDAVVPTAGISVAEAAEIARKSETPNAPDGVMTVPKSVVEELVPATPEGIEKAA